jgi:hypothetical protein
VVDVFDPAGRQLRSIRDAHPRAALTQEMIDALPAPPAGMSRAAHYPDSIPALTGVVADREGYVWAVARVAPGVDTTSARVYDADGCLAAVVALPARFELKDVRGDRVVGVHRDDMDVETVVVYALRREEG